MREHIPGIYHSWTIEILYQCQECGWYSADEEEAEDHSYDRDHLVLDYELGPEDIYEREDFEDR